jgi:hypothetical protein
LKALKSLRPVFGKLWLSEITPDLIEDYVEQRLRCRRKVHTRLGIKYLGPLETGDRTPGVSGLAADSQSGREAQAAGE